MCNSSRAPVMPSLVAVDDVPGAASNCVAYAQLAKPEDEHTSTLNELPSVPGYLAAHRPTLP